MERKSISRNGQETNEILFLRQGVQSRKTAKLEPPSILDIRADIGYMEEVSFSFRIKHLQPSSIQEIRPGLNMG
jgi:hypothetical protein